MSSQFKVSFPTSPAHTPPSSPRSKYTLAPAEDVNLHDKVKQVANTTTWTPSAFDGGDLLLPDWPEENDVPKQSSLSTSDTRVSKKAKQSSLCMTAPVKPSRSNVQSPYEKRYEQLTSNFFLYEGKTYKTSHLDDGSYSSVYLITESESRIIPGIDNSALVLKCFHGRVGVRFRERGLDNYLQHAAQNYTDIAALGLKIAPIYNMGRLMTDHVVIQQKITNPINCLDDRQLSQAKLFFDQSVERGVVMDLQCQNLRVENDGMVYLIDFVEEPEEITVLLHKALKSWTKLFKANNLSENDTRARLQYLAAACLKNKKYLTAAIYTLLYNREPINA